MLILNDLSVRIAGRFLIEHANVRLPDGAKTGFVGHNGTGKSTLFRVISGDLVSETGEVILPKIARIGQVLQEAPGSEQPLLEIVLEADKERKALLKEAETATDFTRIAEIHTRLSDIDAYSAEARAGSILSGLGFDSAAQARPASSFSGGWRMRVALAAVLFMQPDLLLLDEPTNYLDLEGTLWLVEYIRRYPHMVIIISHDRDLLNSATTSILHLENRKLTFWRGNYDQFRQQKSETITLLQKQAAKQEARRKHMEAFVARFRAKASKAGQAQARLKMLEKMKPVLLWQEENVPPFSFPQPEKTAASPIIALTGVDVGYEPEKPVLYNLNLRIDHDDRIALLGANGNGKSTFARLLGQRLKPLTGTVTRAPGLKVAFFAQHQLDDLYPEETAIEHIRRILPGEAEARVRARIARMGLSSPKMMTKAKDLSGGEKARLLMGLATFEGPNLLILDEPTNHLDIDSRSELVHALNDFNGAVILITHDRHLIEATVDQLWTVGKGSVNPYAGDMASYRQKVLASSRQNARQTGNTAQKIKGKPRKTEAGRHAELVSLRKEIKKIEKILETLAEQVSHLDKEFADSGFFQKNPEKAARKAKQRVAAAEKLEQAESRWLLLSSKLEKAADGSV